MFQQATSGGTPPLTDAVHEAETIDRSVDNRNNLDPNLSTTENKEEALPSAVPAEQINKDQQRQLSNAPKVTDDIENKDQLDDEVIEVLGDDPQAEDPQVGTLHKELATRWSSYISEGLKKETKADLLKKYPRANNCQLEAQTLNPEIAATMQDAALKRDKYASEIQKVIGSALLALGQGISLMLDEKEEGIDKIQLLQYLSDAGKLMTEAHHREAKKSKQLNPSKKLLRILNQNQ
ncbi:uncharacterized protein LOC141538235 [Cotesia typhae]|uniref:uncharacterized protein LOC141538235 n=1 Tax=Cotesia typhae TaxID=2053667 RepID=UPI003D69F755